MSKVLNLQKMSIREMAQKIEEEIKSFFINGGYQFPVSTDEKNDLKEACKEASGNLYQEDWNVEVTVKCENIDGTFEVEVVDVDEEPLNAVHLTLEDKDFSEELNQTLSHLNIVDKILNWPEEPSRTITFVVRESEVVDFIDKIQGLGEISTTDLQDGQYWDGNKVIEVENGIIL